MLMLRCARVIASGGYAAEARLVHTPGHDLNRESCSF
jgi:hypothetical protein